MPKGLSAGLPCVGEIKIFDHDGATPVPPRQPQDRRYRRPKPPIADARWTGV
jgi:hypothetical protein